MSCREQLSRLNVHVELASRINRALEEKSLTDLGKLEQDLVFGDATSKEVISYLSSPAASNLPAEDKVSPFQLNDPPHRKRSWTEAYATCRLLC